MKVYDPSQPLISLHVPKTAGTSLRLSLGRLFGPERFKLHYEDVNTLGLPPRHELRGPICIHGHFDISRGYGVDLYYPHAQQFITFFREPFDRAVSLYFFLRKHHLARRRSGSFCERTAPAKLPLADDDFMSFDRWVSFLVEEEASGRGMSQLWFLPGTPDFDLVKRDLESRFVFVGVTERFGASLQALTNILGKGASRERFVNKTPRTDQDFSRWRQAHQKAFPHEYELYELALRLNQKQLAACGGLRSSFWKLRFPLLPATSAPGLRGTVHDHRVARRPSPMVDVAG